MMSAKLTDNWKSEYSSTEDHSTSITTTHEEVLIVIVATTVRNMLSTYYQELIITPVFAFYKLYWIINIEMKRNDAILEI